MKSAFGVDEGISKAYTTKEKKDIKTGGAVGAAAGGVYGGALGSIFLPIGGQVAGIKATQMHRAANNPPDMSAKHAGNPNYSKWQKATNLADRAGTPEEGHTARAMADKINAKHGPFTSPKVKKLGMGYKTLRRVQRLSNPKTAAAFGVGLGAAGGAKLGVDSTKKQIDLKNKKKADKAAKAAA